MEKAKHILIVAGEASGDLHAADLAGALKQINPALTISGVGGMLMRKAGVEICYDIKELAVLGLFDVLKKLPRFIALQKLILKKMEEEKIDAIILVDFSGFNLRLAKKINQKIPAIYYISPQVWASRTGRVKTIKRYISKMIVILKFEEEFYKNFRIDAAFVGHPLLDIVKPAMEKKVFMDEFKLSESKTTIALLPGSRRSEIENILPIMLKTSVFLQNSIKEIQFVIAKAPGVDWDIYNSKIKDFKNIDLKVIEGKTYDCLGLADFCLVASGTATLETAIMQKPLVVIYKMGLLNYLFYRPQVKVNYIGMVNILAGRQIVPEFVQFNTEPREIAARVLEILENPSEMERIKKDLGQVKSLLGEKGASHRAAQIIVDMLGKGN
jgi:lipid-A-disaccharide synthase